MGTAAAWVPVDESASLWKPVKEEPRTSAASAFFGKLYEHINPHLIDATMEVFKDPMAAIRKTALNAATMGASGAADRATGLTNSVILPALHHWADVVDPKATPQQRALSFARAIGGPPVSDAIDQALKHDPAGALGGLGGDLLKAAALVVAPEAVEAAGAAVPAMARAASRALPEISPGTRDLIGIASPRVGRALDLLERVRKAVAPPVATESPATGPMPAQPTTSPGTQVYSPEIIDALEKHLNQHLDGPVAAPASTPVAEPPIAPTAPVAAPVATLEPASTAAPEIVPRGTSKAAVEPPEPGYMANRETANRAARATAAAKFLHMEGRGLTYRDVLKFGEEQWKITAEGADTLLGKPVGNIPRPLSEATKKVILEMLKLNQEMGPTTVGELMQR